MIQVFRQIEKTQVLFSIFSQKVRRKNIEIFLKEPMLDKKRKEGEGEYNKRMGSRNQYKRL